MNYIVTILDKKHVVEYLISLVACGFNTDIEVDKPLIRGPCYSHPKQSLHSSIYDNNDTSIYLAKVAALM